MADTAQVASNPALTDDERLWGTLAHLSALTIWASGLGHIVAPLIIWLWKRESSPHVAEEAREALNFNISVTIYGFVCLALCLIVIGIPLLVALHTFQVICIIVAALKAYEGRHFRYPLNLRLVK